MASSTAVAPARSPASLRNLQIRSVTLLGPDHLGGAQRLVSEWSGVGARAADGGGDGRIAAVGAKARARRGQARAGAGLGDGNAGVGRTVRPCAKRDVVDGGGVSSSAHHI